MKRLAGAVSVFHDAIFLAILPAAIIFIAGGIVGFAVIDGGRWEEVCLKTAISAVLYILELWGFTLLGWQLFKGDCPLNLLEYSLRGLGGYTIDFWRFKSMATHLEGANLPKRWLRRLLWRSGLYVLAAAATIASSIAAVVALL